MYIAPLIENKSKYNVIDVSCTFVMFSARKIQLKFDFLSNVNGPRPSNFVSIFYNSLSIYSLNARRGNERKSALKKRNPESKGHI